MKTTVAPQPKRKQTSRKAAPPSNGNHAAESSLSANGQSSEAAILLAALVAVRQGDLSARLPVSWTGLNGRIADTFNDIVNLHEEFANELERVSQVVGREGKINQR